VAAIAERADTMPDIASWVALRKAAVTRDSAERAALYATVTLPVARDRIPWVEAHARETAGDTVGALRAYQALPAPITTLRLRYVLASTDSAQRVVRAELVRFIDTVDSPSAVREAIGVFDAAVRHPSPQEQLTIARAAAAAGALGRARQGFSAAEVTSLLTNRDRFAYANALARTGAQSTAAGEYDKVTAPRTLVAAAKYQRARMLLASGHSTAAMRQLHEIEARYPTDTSTAWSLWLRADLASDANEDTRARSLWRELARRFPHSSLALSARFNAALVAFIQNHLTVAHDELRALLPLTDDYRARYWLGRTLQRQGDSAAARREWRTILAHDSTSYYAVLAAQQLDQENLHGWIDTSAIAYPSVPSVDSAARRLRELRALGMTPEARFESNRLFRDAPSSRNLLLATAAAFAGTEDASRAITLGWQALSSYGATPAIYRLIYPIAARDTIVRMARQYDIDPILVAALIRQESNFNPRATSVVGARGLMQVMPSVAEPIAKTLGLSGWSAARLYDPGINIMVGTAHLAPLIRSQRDVARVLAAYNAGESRVVRWAKKTGADDPELFTERIPFAETRDYVKSVLRNRAFYRALYPW
jgi:soluble lytic murein transglycosylase